MKVEKLTKEQVKFMRHLLMGEIDLSFIRINTDGQSTRYRVMRVRDDEVEDVTEAVARLSLASFTSAKRLSTKHTIPELISHLNAHLDCFINFAQSYGRVINQFVNVEITIPAERFTGEELFI